MFYLAQLQMYAILYDNINTAFKNPTRHNANKLITYAISQNNITSNDDDNSDDE